MEPVPGAISPARESGEVVSDELTTALTRYDVEIGWTAEFDDLQARNGTTRSTSPGARSRTVRSRSK